jgi:hypothetical protein
MKARWDSLIAAFYDRETDAIDPTKLPDLYGQHATDQSITDRSQRDALPRRLSLSLC